jgi:ABC-type polysaccharide/polyol phosphate export permease
VKSFTENLADILRFRELLWALVARELKSRYRGSWLGFLWAFLSPLAMFFVYFVLFSLLTDRLGGMARYDLFILSGYFPWLFFQQSVAHSTPVFRQSGVMLRMVYFPRGLLPSAVTVGTFVHFLFAFTLLFAFAIVRHGGFSPALFLSFLLFIPHFLIAFGVSLIFSVIAVYFRDTEHLVNILLSIWFFGSPVLYPTNSVLHKLPALAEQIGVGATRFLGIVFFANPLLYILRSYQRIFYEFQPPLPLDFAVALGAGLLLSYVGLRLLFKYQPYFAEEV